MDLLIILVSLPECELSAKAGKEDKIDGFTERNEVRALCWQKKPAVNEQQLNWSSVYADDTIVVAVVIIA